MEGIHTVGMGGDSIPSITTIATIGLWSFGDSENFGNCSAKASITGPNQQLYDNGAMNQWWPLESSYRKRRM